MYSQLLFCLLAITSALISHEDQLPSWNEGTAKTAILEFVSATCTPSNPQYVKPADRIAAFDQDGTLWVEHPLYTQAVFALDRLQELAPSHPEWKEKAPFKAILSGDREAIAQLSEQDWTLIIAETHSGMSIENFANIVHTWLTKAKHPRFKQPYTQLIYQPMIEVMDYLSANGYKTYIVTGGGQEFVRVYSQPVYGISSEHIIGSSLATTYEYSKDGIPTLMRSPKLFFNSDFGGKPVGINLFIGKRPYAAFGNSDGDRDMLEWTQAGEGKRLMMLVLHDDAEREYAYGPANNLPKTTVGKFSESLLDEAKKKGWNIISMKKDWKRLFSFD